MYSVRAVGLSAADCTACSASRAVGPTGDPSRGVGSSSWLVEGRDVLGRDVLGRDVEGVDVPRARDHADPLDVGLVVVVEVRGAVLVEVLVEVRGAVLVEVRGLVVEVRVELLDVVLERVGVVAGGASVPRITASASRVFVPYSPSTRSCGVRRGRSPFHAFWNARTALERRVPVAPSVRTRLSERAAVASAGRTPGVVLGLVEVRGLVVGLLVVGAGAGSADDGAGSTGSCRAWASLAVVARSTAARVSAETLVGDGASCAMRWALSNAV